MDDILLETESRMEATIDSLDKRLLNIRAGRANPAILDGVVVNYYGVDTPLKQLANISIPEARQLSIKPFDKGALGAIEKGIYEKLLADRDVVVTGTVKELADKYETDLQTMVGFLDGINDSLKEPNPIEEMDENTQVSLDIDYEKLYYNMVGCRAEWLYTLDIIPGI